MALQYEPGEVPILAVTGDQLTKLSSFPFDPNFASAQISIAKVTFKLIHLPERIC